MKSDSTILSLLETDNASIKDLPSKHQVIPKNCFQTYICCCCNNSNDLTQHEYTSYKNLVTHCNILFDINNDEHKTKLNTFHTYAKAELIKHKPQLETEESGVLWKDFGFQSEIPENDFRGGGVMSLDCMINFSNDFSKEIGEMFNTECFCFAIIAIKLCFFLRVYFMLFDKDEMERQKKSVKINISGRKEMKRFCNGLSKDDNFFYEIFNWVMLITWKMYKERFEHGKGVLNMLKVDPIINEVIGLVEKVFGEESDEYQIKEKLRKVYVGGLKI